MPGRKGSHVKRIRIGASDHFAARPLLFGLQEHASNGVELVYGLPGQLALWLERGDVDAALIPSIEFLRGVGERAVAGPVMSARGRAMDLLLVSQQPLDRVKRIAVDEFSRTQLVALRAVLDKLHRALPDLCVVKQRPLDASNWRVDFDAALLTENDALAYACREPRAGETSYDVGGMWQSLYGCPLVISLWAYNDENLRREIEPLLVSSRDRGVANLRAIAETVSRGCAQDADALYQCYRTAWNFELGIEEEEGFRMLEEVACAYQLLQTHRLEKALTA